MSIEERVKVLEKKVSKLEGGNLLKEEAKSPYETKSKKEITMSDHQKKENE
jgi:cell division protein FtsB